MMIYFDNAATTLIKPDTVKQAVQDAMERFGNPGRSFHAPSMAAARAVYAAREELARLVGLDDPLNVSFTSSATESLNLVTDAILDEGDYILTAAASHNSVLRPLYRKKCVVTAAESQDELISLLNSGPKAVIISHGSNVTGDLDDVTILYKACRERGIILVLDAAQTLGGFPVTADMADTICFTGHKSLFGPQGTGGIMMTRRPEIPLKVHKTGGTGSLSFEKLQHDRMPELFEAGTLNSHGLNGLAAGASFVRELGVDTIHKREMALTDIFIEGVKDLPGVMIYGDFDRISQKYAARLPIVSINIADMDSGELAENLWNDYNIAVRPGIHCAPLIHKTLGTESRGTARFSFSWFNTEDEILAGVEAIRAYALREQERHGG